MVMQNPSGTGGATVGTSGGTITIDVGENEDLIIVGNPATRVFKHYRVTPGKPATVRLPEAPAESIIYIEIGRGLKARFKAVLIVTGVT